MSQLLPLQVFISYSHKDDQFRRELETHLSALERQGVIAAWSDRAIEAGQEWQQAIQDKLETAAIILLLVSADFLASRFISTVELQQAMARHEAGQARVIPVLVRPCDWQEAPFSKLQAVPDSAKPIAKWGNRDEAFTRVAQAIRQAAEAIHLSAVEAASDTPESGRAASRPRLQTQPRLREPAVTNFGKASKQPDRKPQSRVVAAPGPVVPGHSHLASRRPWILLGVIGSGTALIATGAWVIVTLLSPIPAPERPPNVSAQGGSVAVGGNLTGSQITNLGTGPSALGQPPTAPPTSNEAGSAPSGSR